MCIPRTLTPLIRQLNFTEWRCAPPPSLPEKRVSFSSLFSSLTLLHQHSCNSVCAVISDDCYFWRVRSGFSSPCQFLSTPAQLFSGSLIFLDFLGLNKKKQQYFFLHFIFINEVIRSKASHLPLLHFVVVLEVLLVVVSQKTWQTLEGGCIEFWLSSLTLPQHVLRFLVVILH